jgi:hypothetical protein
MNAVLNYKDEKLSDYGFGFTIDVSLDSNCGVFRRYHVGNNPVNFVDPLGLFSVDDAVSGAIEGFQHGWDSGYYKCLAKCMAGDIWAPVSAKGVEELATRGVEHGGAEWVAKKYYTFKYPNWFTAGGNYSKVLVPKLAGYMKLGAKAISVVGWGYFIYEEYECVKKCKKCL